MADEVESLDSLEFRVTEDDEEDADAMGVLVQLVGTSQVRGTRGITFVLGD
ncbi:hypothetical protein ACIQ9P_33600 [Kitasatospora sp. NPDC094019]|uniref:hypothetical protein n=1 Tax=Kitasatospora sp. NPDC094019 TaxID=3364091 RepID=UPI00381932BC